MRASVKVRQALRWSRFPMPKACPALLALSLLGASLLVAQATTPATTPSPDTAKCESDAMIVFDASGSMTGMGFGETTVTRIQQVRRALASVLPQVAPMRNLGLVVFGPGVRSQCHNIDLRLPPGPNSAARIMTEVNALQPYGQTPLTGAVAAAADALDFRDRPAVIVLLTDGEETCRGNPCALGQALKTMGAGVTVHVIGYMLNGTNVPAGGQFVRCLSETTGGMFISTETTEELTAALQKTLGCPILSSLGKPAPLAQAHTLDK
jgi:Ca-activated chloride channel family protein